ncbi:hypothetical protein FRB97_003487 [Tulasnella sp. 331]|nr:hypothetical protein FRB97_003487 [Tulasnella sp. 331]
MSNSAAAAAVNPSLSDPSSLNLESNLDSLHILAMSDAPGYSLHPSDTDTLSYSSYATSPADSTTSPPYSVRIAPDEIFLDGSPAVASSSTRANLPPLQLLSFKYRSASMSLIIHAKQSKATTTPAFGYRGAIDATLQVDGVLRPTDSIQLIIEGIATSTAIGNCSTFSRRVLHYTLRLHPAIDNNETVSRNKESVVYPISYQLPATAEELDIPLPPSFYLRRPQTEASVRYSCKILLTRKGLLRRNEDIETVFLYLPRSNPPSKLPPSWWSCPSTASASDPKTFPYPGPYAYSPNPCLKEWKTLTLTPPHILPNVHMQLCLPSELKYEACSRIPVKIMVSAENVATSDLMLQNICIDLTRTTTITSRDKFEESNEETLGTASFCERDGWMPPCTDAESGMVVRTLHGVEYAVRVGIQSLSQSKTIIPDYIQSQPIELTTHSCDEEVENEVGLAQAPALGLVGRS